MQHLLDSLLLDRDTEQIIERSYDGYRRIEVTRYNNDTDTADKGDNTIKNTTAGLHRNMSLNNGVFCSEAIHDYGDIYTPIELIVLLILRSAVANAGWSTSSSASICSSCSIME